VVLGWAWWREPLRRSTTVSIFVSRFSVKASRPPGGLGAMAQLWCRIRTWPLPRSALRRARVP
jgi:hypothetical protein